MGQEKREELIKGLKGLFEEGIIQVDVNYDPNLRMSSLEICIDGEYVYGTRSRG